MRCARTVGSAWKIRFGLAVASSLALGGCRRTSSAAPPAGDSAESAAVSVSSAADLPAPPPVQPPPAPPPPPPGADEAGSCPSSLDEATGVLVSPLHAVVGAPLRVLSASLADPE